MTPKEKAKQLRDKYFALVSMTHAEWNLSKQCALIAVDEMLTWLKAHSYSNKNYDAFVYYNEVKQEIEAL